MSTQPVFPTLFSDQPRPYHGPELRPHFLLTEFGLRGSALGAFIGPCQVKTDHLVDWEDRLANDRIEARSMVHFLGEFFGATLKEGVLRQRLFIAQLAQSILRHLEKTGQAEKFELSRDGDDIFLRARDGKSEPRKMSVSIVTASPVSQLLHVGINIDPTGAPVSAVGLAEIGIEPQAWAREALVAFAREYDSVEWAIAKVRPVMG